MHLFYQWFFPAVWIAYLVYWQIAATHVKATARLEPASSRILRTLFFFIAVGLLVLPHLPLPWLYRRFLPNALWTFYLGAAITLAGLLFSIWARVFLGTNWSQSVTIKQNHELITRGPYSLVRHPIYTGLLAGFLGSAIATTQFRGLIAFALVFFALWSKLRLEEQWMRSQFGETYLNYSRHTTALIPWLL